MTKEEAFHKISDHVWSGEDAELILARIMGICYTVEYEEAEGMDVRSELDALSIRN